GSAEPEKKKTDRTPGALEILIQLGFIYIGSVAGIREFGTPTVDLVGRYVERAEQSFVRHPVVAVLGIGRHVPFVAEEKLDAAPVQFQTVVFRGKQRIEVMRCRA